MYTVRPLVFFGDEWKTVLAGFYSTTDLLFRRGLIKQNEGWEARLVRRGLRLGAVMTTVKFQHPCRGATAKFVRTGGCARRFACAPATFRPPLRGEAARDVTKDLGLQFGVRVRLAPRRCHNSQPRRPRYGIARSAPRIKSHSKISLHSRGRVEQVEANPESRFALCGRGRV
jgi:hypothetical protein